MRRCSCWLLEGLMTSQYSLLRFVRASSRLEHRVSYVSRSRLQHRCKRMGFATLSAHISRQSFSGESAPTCEEGTERVNRHAAFVAIGGDRCYCIEKATAGLVLQPNGSCQYHEDVEDPMIVTRRMHDGIVLTTEQHAPTQKRGCSNCNWLTR